MSHAPPTFLFNEQIDKRRVSVVAAVLAVAAATALLVNGALAAMITRTFAADCSREAPATNCVATLPAEVHDTWDDYSEAEPYERLLNLNIPDTSRDTVEAWLSMPDANRLDAELGSKVTVTMYDGEVQAVTARNGETAPTSHAQRPALAALEFAGWLLAVVVALAALTRLRVHWLRRALAASAAGAVVALVTTLITDAHVTATWAVPIMAAAYLLTATAVVLVRTREHATASIRWQS
jgi:hypothetical protein